MATLLIRDLTPGTHYYLQFRADDGTQVSDWSRRFDLYTDQDTVAPDVPLWATVDDWVVDGDTFVANWQAIDTSLDQNKDFSHYELVLTAASISVTIKTNNLAYVLTFDQNRIFFGTAQATVDAKIRALDTNGNASAYTVTKSATNPPPPNVSSVTVQPLYDSISITWPPITGVDDLVGYRVQVSTTSSTTGYVTVYEGPDVTFNYTTYSYALDHYVRVYAIDEFGSVSASPVTSGAVRPKSGFTLDTTPPANPTGVTATASFNTTTQESYIDVAWTANTETDLNGYTVRYGQVSGSWTYIHVDSSATGVRLVVVPGKSYYIGVAATDYSNNVSGYTTPTPDPTASTADTVAPSTPTAPTVVVNTLHAQVNIPGTKAAGGAMESDVAYYEVYGSTTTGFTPASSSMLGTIQNGPAIIGTFDIPASSGSGSSQTWYFKIIAVDTSGNKSTASAQTSGAVGLIDTANITDLAVTNAKINDLVATKITAGTINTGNINIASSLIIGDATHAGAIESYGYVANTTGFHIDKTNFEINQGTIAAAALKLQDSNNIMPNAFADFELNSSYYFTDDGAGTYTAKNLNWSSITSMVPSIDSAFSRFGIKSLKIVQSAATGRTIYFASSSTVNNIFFPNDGAEYFVSFWVRPSVTNALTAVFANGNTTHTTATVKRAIDDATTLVASTWQQVYMVTTAVSLDSGNIRITLPAVAGTWYFDGVMVERKIAASTKPGAYTPPSVTIVDGGMVKVGSIESSNLGYEWDTATSSFITGTQPAFSIDPEGDATFASLQVLGNVIVGDSSDVANSGKYVMASAFYSPGTDGWIMHGDGWVEFNQITANTINGDSIIANTLSAEKLTTGVLGADIKVMGGGGFSIFAPGAVVTDDPIIKLNPTDGLVIDPPGTGYISVPSDPTKQVLIQDISLTATDATFAGNVSIYGSNNYIAGDVVLEQAVSDPTVAPAVVSGWSDASTYLSTTPPAGYSTTGLVEDTTGSYWVTGIINGTSKNGQIYKINKTTGAYSSLISNMTITRTATGSYGSEVFITTGPDLLRGIGKIVISGGTYYAALVHYPAQSGSATGWNATHTYSQTISYSFPAYWAINIYDSVSPPAGSAPTITWTYTPASGQGNPSMYSDGTYFYIASAANTSPYNFTVKRFNYDGTGVTTVASTTGGGVNTSVSALWYGNADLGSGVNRWFVGGTQSYFYSLSGVSVANETTTQFKRANDEEQWGLWWDGTQFRSINNVGKIYKYSTFTGTETSRAIKYAWYDSTVTTHESLESPSTSTTTLRRGWFKVTTSAPKDNGGTDDPDSVRIYIDDIRQTDLGSGVITNVYGTFATSGSGPITGTSEFASLPQLGSVSSKALDTNSNSLIELKGDGTWNLSGALKRVGSTLTNSTGSTIANTTASNNGTVTVALKANYIYRVTAQGNFTPGTAGQYFTMDINHGVGATTGGTNFASAYVDCRAAGRVVFGSATGEFTAGTTQTENIVLVCTGQGGTLARYAAPCWVIVDEIGPA